MSDRVFVFDLDDTLYLERDYVRSGFASVGAYLTREYDVTGAGDFAWALFERGVRGSTFNQLAAHFEIPEAAIPQMIETYRDHSPEISLQPDAAAFLENLPGDVVATGIITDGYANGQWEKIKALELAGRIDTIVVTGERGAGWTKPSAHPFRHIEAAYPAGGIEFTYFGDNPAKDFQSPRALGWRTVRVRRPLGLHADVADEVTVDETLEAFPALPLKPDQDLQDEKGELE